MNKLLNIVIAVYPPDWRVRYEDEFRAMLELCDLSLTDWLDMGLTALETRTGYTRREIMQDLLNRLTGLIALVSALGFASAFFIPEEGTSEFMLIISPLLSILLIPAFHRILKIHHPKTSFIVMMAGIGAIALLVFNFVFSIAVSIAGLRESAIGLITVLSTISLVMIGVWLISVNVLAAKVQTLPIILAFVGIVAGAGWIVTMTTTMVTSFSDFAVNDNSAFAAFYGVALVSLLIGYFLWAIATGLYFISGTVSRKLQVAY